VRASDGRERLDEAIDRRPDRGYPASGVRSTEQFTREEIEKHHTEQDCWIVVNGRVYDATSVLSWHPGGKAPIMGHAGRVHPETTEEYESIHDEFAHQKLNGKKDSLLLFFPFCSVIDRIMGQDASWESSPRKPWIS
jgi:cytochrome b involved in lipid metabolism